MRKLILALSAFALLAGSVYAYDEPSFNAPLKLRTPGQFQGEPTRIIKLVRNASGDSAGNASYVSGDAVRYSLNSDDGVTVAISEVSADGAFAGIVATTIQTWDGTTAYKAQDDAGKRNWGWIVIHGPATAKLAVAGAGNNYQAGDSFITSSDSGTVTGWRAGTPTPDGNAVTRGTRFGFFMNTATTENSTRPQVFVMAT